MSQISNTAEIAKLAKANHGLFLDGYSIQPSKQPIFTNDDEFNINSYNGSPIVYTSINDPASPTNLLDINLDKDNFDQTLQPFDVCISFPIAEITYDKGDLSKYFLECDKEKLHELYAKYNTINPFNNLPGTLLLPEIKTLDGEELNTPGKLVNWMNSLYREEMIHIISYDDFIPVTQLKCEELTANTLSEKLTGVANFKEKLSLEEWVGDNLTSWARLGLGLIINEKDEIEISKKFAIEFTKIPDFDLSDKFYLGMIKPSTKSEVILVSNNIFSIKDLSTFPFIKSNEKSYGNYIHHLVNCEQYEILLNRGHIKPAKEFEQAIDKALNSMMLLKALQNIFNEYGHLFSQKIILGRSLKIILPNNANTASISPNYMINLKPPIFESLKPHLDKLNIPYFLTQNEEVIETNDIPDLIQNTNNLEIIEFDDVIPFYKILKKEQQKEIDIVLSNYKQSNYKIIMTGITYLKDLNDNDFEHYKRINVELESPLEDENYEVFGSIISKNHSKLGGIYVNFGLYDLNGFYAKIKKLDLEETNINITECYVLWMIVEVPSKLSGFSPKNREFKVNFIKESITLQPDKSNYYIKIGKTPFPLSRGCTISVHANYSSSVNVIELVEWNYETINVQIKPEATINIELRICILSTDCTNLKIDNRKEEFPLNLIGDILTENLLSNDASDNPWMLVLYDILWLLSHLYDVIFEFLIRNSILSVRFDDLDGNLPRSELNFLYLSNWISVLNHTALFIITLPVVIFYPFMVMLAMEPKHVRPPEWDMLNEEWFFINGMMVNEEWIDQNCRYLEARFKRGVTGLLNRSYGIFLDVVEVILGRSFEMNTTLVHLVTDQILQALRNDEIKTVRLIAHSQGTIIANLALKKIYLELNYGGEQNLLQKLEVYTFANVCREFINPGGLIRCIEHYANKHDPVAMLGVLNPTTNKLIQGEIFVNERRNGGKGHLFNSYYSLDAGDYESIRSNGATPKLLNLPGSVPNLPIQVYC